jgi:DHA2 family multidrug resistance protein
MLARRAQHHQVNLSDRLNPSNPAFQATLSATARSLQAKGFSAADATHRAYGMMQNMVFRQANMLAYVDCFWLLGAAILAMIPMLLLMKKSHPGGEIAVH